jgi:putative oxidoreductase
MIVVVCVCLAIIGPGRLSLDRALGIDKDFDGAVGAVIAVAGLAAAAAMLGVCWRPGRPFTSS